MKAKVELQKWKRFCVRVYMCGGSFFLLPNVDSFLYKH